MNRILIPSGTTKDNLFDREEHATKVKEKEEKKRRHEVWRGEANSDNRNSLPPAFLSLAMIASEAEK